MHAPVFAPVTIATLPVRFARKESIFKIPHSLTSESIGIARREYIAAHPDKPRKIYLPAIVQCCSRRPARGTRIIAPGQD